MLGRLLLFIASWAILSGAQEPILFPDPSAPTPWTAGQPEPFRGQSEVVPEPSIAPSVEETPAESPLSAPRAKSLYLTLIDLPERTLYQREIIALTYRLLILAESSELQTEFLLEDESVAVRNPDSPWQVAPDGSLRNTFYLKINDPDFTLPALRVSALIEGAMDSDESEARRGKAIALDQNPLFSRVIAKELRLTDHKITSYDHEHNLAVFRLEAQESNLEDFALPYYKKQGIESSSFSPDLSWIIYYVILPKSQETIEMDYFSSSDYQYHRLALQNLAIDDRVSTQSDIKPKNTLRIFEFILLAALSLVILVLYFYRRQRLFLGLFFVIWGYIAYSLSIKDEGFLKPNSAMRILPTYNSTIILQSPKSLKIEILGERGDYFKVISEDEKIGWVRKDEIEKN